MQKLLRRKEAASRLGLKPVSMQLLEAQGILHPIRDWAGHRRYAECEVDQVLKDLLAGKLAPSHRNNAADH